MPKISALNEITNPEPDDILAGVDDSAETTKYIKIGTLINLMYPVGSLYMNRTDNTSPATLFGVGTWVRIQGRVIVGVSDTDPDFGEGDIGGQKTVQAHSHGITVRNDDFNRSGATGLTGPSFDSANDTDPAFRSFGGIVDSAGSGPNNMNPYAAAYVWERTA